MQELGVKHVSGALIQGRDALCSLLCMMIKQFMKLQIVKVFWGNA